MKRRVITLESVIDIFYNQKYMETGKDKMYCHEIERFIKETGIEKIDNITNNKVIEWVRYLNDKGLTSASVNHYLRSVRAWLYWCMNEGYIKPFKIKVMRTQTSKIKYYNDSELEILMAKPKMGTYTEERTWAIICFIMATGARASTVINIRMDDIDLLKGEVFYRHLKNKSTAVIPLNKTICNILLGFRNGWEGLGDEFLFPESNGKQMTVGALNQSINRYCDRRGVKHRGTHSLRHSFSREFLKNHGDLFSLQQFLTHSDLNTTRGYCKVVGEELRQVSIDYIPLDKYVSDGVKTAHRKGR